MQEYLRELIVMTQNHHCEIFSETQDCRDHWNE